MAQTPSPEGTAISYIRILVCRVDDACADRIFELAVVDLPQPDPTALAAETVLDTLEATTLVVGHTILRAAFQAPWAAVDAQLVEAYCRRFPADQVRRERHKAITYAERWGGSARRECLDQLLILNERHLQRVLTAYTGFYNQRRPHQGLRQRCPILLARGPGQGPIVRHIVLDGIIHDHERQEVA